MKILMLNSEYPPLGGGQGNANRAILDCLTKHHQDISVDLVTASTDRFFTSKQRNNRLFFLDIGKKNRNYLFQSVKELLTFSYRCYRYATMLMKQNRYDLIVAWSGIPAGYLAMRLAKKYHIPYIVLLRGADVPFYDKRWLHLDRWVFSRLSPKIWQSSAFTIANSEKLRELAYRTSKRKEIKLLYNGIDLDEYFPAVAKREQVPTILCVGRLNPLKGFDLAIRAVSMIKKEFRLWIVGEGPQREYLEDLIVSLGLSDKVSLLGLKTKPESVELYQRSSLFCLSSYNEGMSNALLEAIACGLPVVAADVGGTDELIHGNGRVVKSGDQEGFRSAIEDILFDPEKIDLMGKHSRELATEFSWEKITDQFVEMMRQVDTVS